MISPLQLFQKENDLGSNGIWVSVWVGVGGYMYLCNISDIT